MGRITNEDIVNRVLVKVMAEPYDSSTTPGRIQYITSTFNRRLTEELESNAWTFARRTAVLQAESTTDTDGRPFYRFPKDLLRILAVTNASGRDLLKSYDERGEYYPTRSVSKEGDGFRLAENVDPGEIHLEYIAEPPGDLDDAGYGPIPYSLIEAVVCWTAAEVGTLYEIDADDRQLLMAMYQKERSRAIVTDITGQGATAINRDQYKYDAVRGVGNRVRDEY